MLRTLLLYDGKMSSAERIASQLSCMIGNAKVAEIGDAPRDLAPYGGFCFVFNYYGAVTAGRTRAFLHDHRLEMQEKRIAMVGIGFSDLGYTMFVTETEKMAGLSGIAAIFISGESETARVGYELCKMMRVAERPLEDAQLLAEIEDYIASHNTLALATSGDGYVRCTPLEYHFRNHAFYIVTEGGYKFRGILENGTAAAVIFDDFTTMDAVHGLQFLGKAAVIPVGSDEYRAVLAENGVTDEALDALPVTLFLLKLLPLRYEYLNADFRARGYDTNQTLETEFLRENWEMGARYATAAQKAEQTNEEAAERLRARLEEAVAAEPAVVEEPAVEAPEVEESAAEAPVVEESATEGTMAGTSVVEEIVAGTPEFVTSAGENFVIGEPEAAEAEILELMDPEPEIPELVLQEPEAVEVKNPELEPQEPETVEAKNPEPMDEYPEIAEPEIAKPAAAEPAAAKTASGTAEFRMPSFMQAYAAEKGQSRTLPEIDMSVIAGLEKGRTTFYEDETERVERRRAAVRKKPVTLTEPDDTQDELADELEDEDSPVYDDALGGVSGTVKKKPVREPRREKRAERKSGGFFSRLKKTLGRMLLIDGEDDDSAVDEDFDEPDDERGGMTERSGSRSAFIDRDENDLGDEPDDFDDDFDDDLDDDFEDDL